MSIPQAFRLSGQPEGAAHKSIFAQVRRLASAAAELGALHIRSTLRELHAESREEGDRMLEGCLALLEAHKPALSEQR